METPSSTRRVTRSQTLANNNSSNLLLSRKVEESEKSMSKSRQMSGKKQPQEPRSALVDITNDSPIVGLAIGSLENPSSAMSKKRMSSSHVMAHTPGSGEALLRGQVKTLLQKVEEEAELSKITLENRRFSSLVKVNSPMISLVAPTPANTPQVEGFTPSVIPSPVVNEKFLISEMAGDMFDEKKQDETEEVIITRSLLLDFSDRSESSSDSLSVKKLQRNATPFGGEDTESSTGKLPVGDDDDASIWSIQVNVSSIRDDDEEEYEEDVSFHEEEYDEECGDNDGVLTLDELCEGLSKVSVNEAGTKIMRKHIRFVYSSDDELEGESESPPPLSGGALRLKGLPTPKGKHLRFPEDGLEEDECRLTDW